MTTATWSAPEQGDDEDYAEYLGRKADQYRDNPQPAPDGFELIGCDASPRHWPFYTLVDDDFYPGPCPYCVGNSYKARADAYEIRYHRLRHPLRGRVARWVLGRMYTLGIIASYGHRYGGPARCNACISGITWRGRRPYILGWPAWKWACLLTRGHWPGKQGYFGLCGKCIPCPDCGTTEIDHDCPGANR